MIKLTRAEVEAIIDYLFIHTRATNGTARKVYEKMLKYLEQGVDIKR